MENKELKKVREAIANYMWSEGCTCCESDNHKEHAKKLAEILKVPMYKDKSGWDFYKFRSKELKK